MDLVVGQTRNDTYIVISLNKERHNNYRLTSSLDNMIDYDVQLKCEEREAVECFKNLQLKYFDEIINEGSFQAVGDDI